MSQALDSALQFGPYLNDTYALTKVAIHPYAIFTALVQVSLVSRAQMAVIACDEQCRSFHTMCSRALTRA